MLKFVMVLAVLLASTASVSMAAVVRRASVSIAASGRANHVPHTHTLAWEPKDESPSLDQESFLYGIIEAFDSFDALREVNKQADRKLTLHVVRRGLELRACDNLGTEPYLVHPTVIPNDRLTQRIECCGTTEQDSAVAQFNEYVNESSRIPSLAEFQKMPNDQLAMQNLMSRLAQSSTIRVGVLGGSMTAGANCRTPDWREEKSCAWPSGLERWLQRTFPHAVVRVINMAVGGVGSLARLGTVQRDMESNGKIDLWILDNMVNDAEVTYRMPMEASTFSVTTEALILKILHSDPTANLMMLATACPVCVDFRENELKIARHYHIPYVDYASLVEQRAQECKVRGTEDPEIRSWTRDCALWTAGTHPGWQAHQHVADAIGYQMGRALSDVCKAPLLPKPSVLNIPQSTFWARDALLKYLPCEKYSAQFSAANATMKRELVSSQGWNLMEDRKDKPGWISDQIGSRITFPLVFGSKPTIGIGFLRSYEKMGQASITIKEPDGKLSPLGEIDGLWENREASKFSVPDIKWYYPRVEPNMNMSVVVEIIHPAEPRESHKMKIVNVVSC
jgi:hypothetical protein